MLLKGFRGSEKLGGGRFIFLIKMDFHNDGMLKPHITSILVLLLSF